MSTLAGKPCPACLAPLVAAPLAWTVLACNACGGVWADGTASARITRTVCRDLVGVARQAAKRADDERTSIVDRDRQCPVCTGALRHDKLGGVALDVCDAHGTWFDRDELGRVARNLDYERKSVEDLAQASAAEDAIPSSSSLELVNALLGD